jgi:hypothetical protein
MIKPILLVVTTLFSIYIGGLLSPFSTIFIFMPSAEEVRQLWLNDMMTYLFISSFAVVVSFIFSLIFKLPIKYVVYSCLFGFVLVFIFVYLREPASLVTLVERGISYLAPIVIILLINQIHNKWLDRASDRKHV